MHDRSPLRALCALLLAMAGAAASAQAPADPAERHDARWWSEQIVGPADSFAGRPISEHAIDWWRWSLAIPKEISPMRDTDGKNCAVQQAGNVWYLGGVAGGGRVRRTCSIPAGKAILFPLITMTYWTVPGTQGQCGDKIADAAANNDHVARLQLWLDGTEMPRPEQYRVRPVHCFAPFQGAGAREFGSTGAPAATDGYWVMLKPLPPGDYTVAFRSAYNRPGELLGAMAQDVEYRLHVEPR